jgi:hypothetical protein
MNQETAAIVHGKEEIFGTPAELADPSAAYFFLEISPRDGQAQLLGAAGDGNNSPFLDMRCQSLTDHLHLW